MTSCGGQSHFGDKCVKFSLNGKFPIDEQTFHFLGRYYAENDVYYTNMSCAGFEVCFEGAELEAELIFVPSDLDHNTYIHVFIDGDYIFFEHSKNENCSNGKKTGINKMI